MEEIQQDLKNLTLQPTTTTTDEPSVRYRQLQDKGVACYPHKFTVTMSVQAFRDAYDNQETQMEEGATQGVTNKAFTQSLAGRIVGQRTLSAKLLFLDLDDGVKTLQVVCNRRDFLDEQQFDQMTAAIKRGDIIGVTGHPGRTKSHEFSLMAVTLQLLSPCYHNLPFPNKLQEDERRQRQRYVDLIVNDRSRQDARTRAAVVRYIREFFWARDFLEVETPTLNVLPGGANARPFVTHHNDLHMNMFLRIAPELYLKQLVIGGLQRVFEIGKNFRNEGIDQTHNPEYTAIESYCAYDDYDDLMRMTEELLSGLVLKLTGSYKLDYVDKNDTLHNIDFTPPFRRVPLIATLEKELQVKFPEDLASEETRLFLEELLKKQALHCEPKTTAKMIDTLVGEYIEPQLSSPGFITDHPQIMSPLAKWHRSAPGLTERFELFVAGKELCNAYTELNDPFKQRACFQSQQQDRDKGDDEAQPIDEGFCVALEHGLPPTGGWGMGIDRLCMLLSNRSAIKDVILFPTMKPLDEERAQQQRIMKNALQALLETGGVTQ
jgi:lysyl-tRNA synthetase class 2